MKFATTFVLYTFFIFSIITELRMVECTDSPIYEQMTVHKETSIYYLTVCRGHYVLQPAKKPTRYLSK